jgi:hypothetical protein
MPVPQTWEALRIVFATRAAAKGKKVPGRFLGMSDGEAVDAGLYYVYCFPAIGDTVGELGEGEFIEVLEDIWADDTPGRRRVVALAMNYFARLQAGERLTRQEAKDAWRAATAQPGRHREHPEAAVAWGLASMLVEE